MWPAAVRGQLAWAIAFGPPGGRPASARLARVSPLRPPVPGDCPVGARLHDVALRSLPVRLLGVLGPFPLFAGKTTKSLRLLPC